MTRATTVAIAALAVLVAIVVLARPRFTSPASTPGTTGTTRPPVEPVRVDTPPENIPPPPSVPRTLEVLSSDVDGGAAAIRSLKDLLDLLDKGPEPSDTPAKLAALGSQFATLHLREEAPKLARCVDEVIAPGMPAATRQGVAKSIREFGARLQVMREGLGKQIERIPALRARKAPWSEALIGLEAEVQRYDMTLQIAQSTAEAEANRAAAK